LDCEAAAAASRGRVSGGDGGEKQASRRDPERNEIDRFGNFVCRSGTEALFGGEKRQRLSAPARPRTRPRERLREGSSRYSAETVAPNPGPDPGEGGRLGEGGCARVEPGPGTAGDAPGSIITKFMNSWAGKGLARKAPATARNSRAAPIAGDPTRGCWFRRPPPQDNATERGVIAGGTA
jgi:hypothetical protein